MSYPPDENDLTDDEVVAMWDEREPADVIRERPSPRFRIFIGHNLLTSSNASPSVQDFTVTPTAVPAAPSDSANRQVPATLAGAALG